jgi:hypothetical protein
MGIETLIGGGLGLLSSVIGADATGDAADQQSAAAANSTALQKYQYDQTRQDNAPWRAAGEASLNKLMGLLNDGSLTSRFSGQNVQNEPGYQFGMQQGQQGIERSAAARGMGLSGAALKAASRFNQDYAGTKYGQAFDRWRMENSDTFNRLSGLAGTGQQVNAANSAAGQNYANAAGQNMIGAANAQGAAGIARGNIYGNAINQFAALGNKNNWWQQPKGASFGATLDPFFGGTGGSGD